MRALLAFRKEDIESEEMQSGHLVCPCSQHLRDKLKTYYLDLLGHCNHPGPVEDGEEEEGDGEAQQLSWSEKLLALVARQEDKKPEVVDSCTGA